MMSLWLVIHMIGAVLFIGNVMTAAFWKVRAQMTNQPAVIHHTVRNVMLADYVFTIPGIVLLIVSGIVMAVRAEWPMSGLNWLTLSLVLFTVTGIIWITLLLPLQRRMIRASAQDMEEGHVSKAYLKASRHWDIYGTIATLLPIAILYLMVVKGF